MKKKQTTRKKTQKLVKKKGKFEPGDFRLRVGRSRAGLGLFTEEDIPKGACVIEYVGRVVVGDEEFTSRSKYLFEVNARLTIDGRPKMNKAGYINHSCRPNCEIEIRNRRVFVMARRNILAGEELLYDYGKEYWDEHIGKDLCRCDKCRERRAKK